MQRIRREILVGGTWTLVLLLFGCQLLTDAHERQLISDGANDSGPRGGSFSSDAQTDRNAGDDGQSVGGSSGEADAEPEDMNCITGLEGPPLVKVVSNGSAYCIDATEVTNADYRRFLDADVARSTRSECSWNADYRPVGGMRGVDDDPVTNLDWCDAFAYCQWARKRLCGAIGGAGDPYRDFALAAVDEWYNACSSGGVNMYPYGNEFSGGICNGSENGGIVKPVRSADLCVAAGVFDLSGNVSEWENACETESADPASDNCRARGGSFLDGAGPLACNADLVLTRNGAAFDIGFRCCQGLYSP